MKHALAIAGLALFFAFVPSARALDISGKVMDKAEKPVAGAAVCLESNRTKCALSGADGTFRLTDASPTLNPKPETGLGFALLNGELRIDAAENVALRIEWFEADGSHASTPINLDIKRGTTRVASAVPSVTGIHFLRVSGAGFYFTWKAMLGGVRAGASIPLSVLEPSASSGASLGKSSASAAAAKPLIIASKAGYRENLYVPVADPDTGAKVFLAGETDSILFNGRTMDGWAGKDGIWKVKDAALDGEIAKGGGTLLLSQHDYSSFRLTGTARMVVSNDHLGICIWGKREASFGYGGCIVFVPPSGSIWDYLDNKGVRTLKYVFPKPDWNHYEILANLTTGEVQMAVNGLEFEKYKEGNPSRRKRGPIGLQLHSWNDVHEVQYKDFVIEIDPKDQTLITVKK